MPARRQLANQGGDRVYDFVRIAGAGDALEGVRIHKMGDAHARAQELVFYRREALNELAQRFPEEWARWNQEPDWDLVPGGEGAERFEARVAAALDAILERHAHGDVLVVTHGGVIQVALHRVVGRPSHGLFPFKIQNASISVIEKRDGRMIIDGSNDVAHLEPSLVTEPGPG